jgi:hypothetical protein
MSALFRAFSAFLSMAMLAGAAWAAEPVFPPGSRLGLVPPQGMVPSQGFQGFEDPATHAAIFVTEMSLNTYPDIEKEFSPEEIKASGMTEEGRETLSLKDGTASVVIVRQPSGVNAIRKWALLAKLDDLTAVVLVLLPEEAQKTYTDAALRAALETIALRPKVPVEQQLALLPYSINELSGFRLVRARPDGVALLTFGPNEAATAEQQPFILISTPREPPPRPAERETFARQLLGTAWDFKEARNLQSETIRIGHDQGHQITGETVSPKTGVELKVVQWLRFGGSNSYLQMLGVARKDAWDEVFPHMRAVRDGIGAK